MFGIIEKHIRCLLNLFSVVEDRKQVRRNLFSLQFVGDFLGGQKGRGFLLEVRSVKYIVGVVERLEVTIGKLAMRFRRELLLLLLIRF